MRFQLKPFLHYLLLEPLPVRRELPITAGLIDQAVTPLLKVTPALMDVLCFHNQSINMHS